MSGTTLKEKAYQELKRMILSGELDQGANVTEQSLVNVLAMSRTPIRAALEKLEAEGLVQYTPNKGVTIVDLSLRQAVDIFDYRMILEPHMVAALAERGLTGEQSAWFADNLKQQQAAVEARDYRQFTVLDAAMHLHLAVCYGNREIVQTMERLHDRMFLLALRVLGKDYTRIDDSYEDHRTVIRLIEQSDAESARRRMLEHLEYGRRMMVL